MGEKKTPFLPNYNMHIEIEEIPNPEAGGYNFSLGNENCNMCSSDIESAIRKEPNKNTGV